jgi:hypothetical protein
MHRRRRRLGVRRILNTDLMVRRLASPDLAKLVMKVGGVVRPQAEMAHLCGELGVPLVVDQPKRSAGADPDAVRAWLIAERRVVTTSAGVSGHRWN